MTKHDFRPDEGENAIAMTSKKQQMRTGLKKHEEGESLDPNSSRLIALTSV
jgi:hypothetical protein